MPWIIINTTIHKYQTGKNSKTCNKICVIVDEEHLRIGCIFCSCARTLFTGLLRLLVVAVNNLFIAPRVINQGLLSPPAAAVINGIGSSSLCHPPHYGPLLSFFLYGLLRCMLRELETQKTKNINSNRQLCYFYLLYMTVGLFLFCFLSVRICSPRTLAGVRGRLSLSSRD